jgi:hypothetical protein
MTWTGPLKWIPPTGVPDADRWDVRARYSDTRDGAGSGIMRRINLALSQSVLHALSGTFVGWLPLAPARG